MCMCLYVCFCVCEVRVCVFVCVFVCVSMCVCVYIPTHPCHAELDQLKAGSGNRV